MKCSEETITGKSPEVTGATRASAVPADELEKRQKQEIRVETAQRIAYHEDRIRGIRTGINVLIGAERFHQAAIKELKETGQKAQGAT